MAVTPNYSWPIPVATDYVKDGWDAIADLGNAIDTTVAGLSLNSMTLLSTTTLTGTTVSITSISQNYTDLIIRIINPYVTGTGGLQAKFNSSTGTDYIYNTNTTATVFYPWQTTVSTSSTNYSFMEVSVPNYAKTTSKKSIKIFNNGIDGSNGIGVYVTAQGYVQTTAISSVQILTNATGFSGGTVEIYGVK